mgnify:CR=1 FL=1
MLTPEIVPCENVDRAVEIFLRDGFVPISGALSDDQLKFIQSGAYRVVEEQQRETAFDDANRGYARYSYGQQIQNPEWQMLVDLPKTLPILDAIFGSQEYISSGGGGDYSHPGAEIQFLHSDMKDMLNDPLGQVTVFDLPSPFVVINFLMTDFNEKNGATRFVPGTHRTRVRPPKIEDEPDHWKKSIIEAPAGTAIIRDVRCWHGGTANNSDAPRIMTSAGYYAPWFLRRTLKPVIAVEDYQKFSDRGKFLLRYLVDWEAEL